MLIKSLIKFLKTLEKSTSIHLINFLICLGGHPLVFWIYYFAVSMTTKWNNHYFIWQTSTNVYKINPGSYLLFGALIYSGWIAFQYLIVSISWKRSIKVSIPWPTFFDKKFTTPYVILCALGWINTIAWFNEMELNIFGFLFFIPVAALTLIVGFLELKLFQSKRYSEILKE